MISVFIEPNFECWRDKARELLAQEKHPHALQWFDNPDEPGLFGFDSQNEASPTTEAPRVSAAFLDIARSAAAHTDPQRWSLLYHILWRMTHGGERHLLGLTTDPDIRKVQFLCKAVGRDIHKMHAFVRFRLVGTDDASGREQFIAWFEPEHRIVRLASSFFRKRFVGMNWSILTPYECVHWNGESLHFSPGVPRSEAPDDDAHDDLWRTYYRSIFNPARLKTKMMQSEMPKKYWKNLPEASIISELIAESQTRTRKMLETENRPVKKAPKNAYLDSLKRMNEQQEP